MAPPVATHAYDASPQVLQRALPLFGPASGHARRIDPFEGRAYTALATAGDALMLLAAAFAAATFTGASSLTLPSVVGAITMMRLVTRGMYGGRPARMPLLDTLKEVVAALGLATIVALAGTAVTGAGRETVHAVLATGAAGAVTVGAVRLIFNRIRRHARVAGLSGRRALIVGAGHVGLRLEAQLRTKPELGLEPVGFLDADPSPAYWDAPGASPVMGGPDDLARAVEETGARHVIVAFSSAPDSTVQPLIRRCEELGLEVSVVPRLYENVNDRQWVEHVDGLPLCGLHRVDPKSWQFTLKHAFDRSVAALLLVVAAPLLAGLALAVRISSPGPVLYRQRRVGRDGREFDILKFRSMRLAPSATTLALVTELDAAGAAPGGVEGIDRRTRLGSFMRQTSLDELPQLLNVLVGHMSLVGPRPERPEFVDHYGTTIRRYDDRHRVKSGMTGWAQVHGLRGQTSLADRVERDNWYIQNWSLWLDFKILFLTPLACVTAPPEDPVPAADAGHSLPLAA